MSTLLSLRNVTAAYTERIVLDAFSLDVHRGDCLHITGEHGMMLGYEVQERGAIKAVADSNGAVLVDSDGAVLVC